MRKRSPTLLAATLLGVVAGAAAGLLVGCSSAGPSREGDAGQRDGNTVTPGRDGPTLPPAADSTTLPPAGDGPPVAVDGAVDATADGSALDAATPDQGGPAVGKLVSIPPGTFTMGSPAGEPCRSETTTKKETQHEVTLTRGFEMAETEVTHLQFWSLMGYDPSYNDVCGDDCPVEWVSWSEAAAYCNALSQLKGVTPCYACTGADASVTCEEAAAYAEAKIYDCPGFRLPTEAEWEYAYRAGIQAAYYSGANVADECFSCTTIDASAAAIAWYCYNAGSAPNTKLTPHPVGKKTKNAWNLFDMAGNVKEWVNDGFKGDLGSGPANDPWGAASAFGVRRGGGYSNAPARLRAADRQELNKALRENNLGFRYVRSSLP